jgi:hypothetical protein
MRGVASTLVAAIALALPLAGCVLEAEPTDGPIGVVESELDLDPTLPGAPGPDVDNPEDPGGGPEPTPWRATNSESDRGGDPGPGPDLKAAARGGTGSSNRDE